MHAWGLSRYMYSRATTRTAHVAYDITVALWRKRPRSVSGLAVRNAAQTPVRAGARPRATIRATIRATSCGHASPHAVWAARTGSKVPKVAVRALPIPVVAASFTAACAPRASTRAQTLAGPEFYLVFTRICDSSAQTLLCPRTGGGLCVFGGKAWLAQRPAAAAANKHSCQPTHWINTAADRNTSRLNILQAMRLRLGPLPQHRPGGTLMCRVKQTQTLGTPVPLRTSTLGVSWTSSMT